MDQREAGEDATSAKKAENSLDRRHHQKGEFSETRQSLGRGKVPRDVKKGSPAARYQNPDRKNRGLHRWRRSRERKEESPSSHKSGKAQICLSLSTEELERQKSKSSKGRGRRGRLSTVSKSPPPVLTFNERGKNRFTCRGSPRLVTQ